MSIAHRLKGSKRTDDVLIAESVNFAGLLLSQSILQGLACAGFERPSPIQLKAIPLGRCGLGGCQKKPESFSKTLLKAIKCLNHLIVQAKSGTGKTCVFTVVALESIDLSALCVQILVLAPTREIAVQIQEVIRTIGSAMIGLKCHTFIGGLPLAQDKVLAKDCHIAVGTPGRVKQLIEIGAFKTSSIRLFVLDEADKLLGGGDFQETINWIYWSLPENKQVLALSATYPESLATQLTTYMRNPTFVRLNISDPALIGIKQYHVVVPNHPMANIVFNSKTDVILKILSSVSFQQCLIFSNMQTRAQNLQAELESRNWPTACIAGCLDQKERNFAIEQLKTYKCRILVSTDLTSRGIDADKVNLVINLDVPRDHETYLHRIGRAGRFGSYGAAISIVSSGGQDAELWAVERKCKTHIPILPQPIPQDLVTQSVQINLDDMVSTEQIINHPEMSSEISSQPQTPLLPGPGQDCESALMDGAQNISGVCKESEFVSRKGAQLIDSDSQLDCHTEKLFSSCQSGHDLEDGHAVSTSSCNELSEEWAGRNHVNIPDEKVKNHDEICLKICTDLSGTSYNQDQLKVREMKSKGDITNVEQLECCDCGNSYNDVTDAVKYSSTNCSQPKEGSNNLNPGLMCSDSELVVDKLQMNHCDTTIIVPRSDICKPEACGSLNAGDVLRKFENSEEAWNVHEPRKEDGCSQRSENNTIANCESSMVVTEAYEDVKSVDTQNLVHEKNICCLEVTGDGYSETDMSNRSIEKVHVMGYHKEGNTHKPYGEGVSKLTPAKGNEESAIVRHCKEESEQVEVATGVMAASLSSNNVTRSRKYVKCSPVQVGFNEHEFPHPHSRRDLSNKGQKKMPRSFAVADFLKQLKEGTLNEKELENSLETNSVETLKEVSKCRDIRGIEEEEKVFLDAVSTDISSSLAQPSLCEVSVDTDLVLNPVNPIADTPKEIIVGNILPLHDTRECETGLTHSREYYSTQGSYTVEQATPSCVKDGQSVLLELENNETDAKTISAVTETKLGLLQDTRVSTIQGSSDTPVVFTKHDKFHVTSMLNSLLLQGRDQGFMTFGDLVKDQEDATGSFDSDVTAELMNQVSVPKLAASIEIEDIARYEEFMLSKLELQFQERLKEAEEELKKQDLKEIERISSEGKIEKREGDDTSSKECISSHMNNTLAAKKQISNEVANKAKSFEHYAGVGAQLDSRCNDPDNVCSQLDAMHENMMRKRRETKKAQNMKKLLEKEDLKDGEAQVVPIVCMAGGGNLKEFEAANESCARRVDEPNGSSTEKTNPTGPVKGNMTSSDLQFHQSPNLIHNQVKRDMSEKVAPPVFFQNGKIKLEKTVATSVQTEDSRVAGSDSISTKMINSIKTTSVESKKLDLENTKIKTSSTEDGTINGNSLRNDEKGSCHKSGVFYVPETPSKPSKLEAHYAGIEVSEGSTSTSDVSITSSSDPSDLVSSESELVQENSKPHCFTNRYAGEEQIGARFKASSNAKVLTDAYSLYLSKAERHHRHKPGNKCSSLSSGDDRLRNVSLSHTSQTSRGKARKEKKMYASINDGHKYTDLPKSETFLNSQNSSLMVGEKSHNVTQRSGTQAQSFKSRNSHSRKYVGEEFQLNSSSSSEESDEKSPSSPPLWYCCCSLRTPENLWAHHPPFSHASPEAFLHSYPYNYIGQQGGMSLSPHLALASYPWPSLPQWPVYNHPVWPQTFAKPLPPPLHYHQPFYGYNHWWSHSSPAGYLTTPPTPVHSAVYNHSTQLHTSYVNHMTKVLSQLTRKHGMSRNT